MDNLADLEKAYRVPCKHCAEQMQVWDLFCPSCGKDQTAAKAAVPVQLLAQPEPVAPLAPPIPAAAQAPALAVPSPQGGSSSATTRARILIGVAAVLLVALGAVLVHDHFVADRQPPPAEDAKLRDFKANVGQLQGALNRGDLEAAARLLDVLEARHLSDPTVQELRMAFDRRTQEQADVRERLRQAALQAPVVAAPAPPAIDVAPPKEKVCNETLAALALCPNR